jgi:hypothetical protein
MRPGIVLLALVLAACSQTQSAGNNSVSPSPVSCRLPISVSDDHGHVQGAFVDDLTGKVTVDPNGVGGAFYDRPFSRWLPVDHHAVSSDGRRYVYLDQKVPGTSARQQLHLVDLSTVNEKLYELAPTGDPAGYVVKNVTAEGVWLSYAGYEGPSGGLFLLDLTTGRLIDVGGKQEIFDAVAGAPGTFWFTDNGLHPQPRGGIGGNLLARVQRLTIPDGKAESWFVKDGSDLRVLGVDMAGHPVVADQNDYWLASTPSDSKVIELPGGFYQLFTDRHGLWFGGDRGVYLYTEGGVRKVSDQKGMPAGACA